MRCTTPELLSYRLPFCFGLRSDLPERRLVFGQGEAFALDAQVAGFLAADVGIVAERQPRFAAGGEGIARAAKLVHGTLSGVSSGRRDGPWPRAIPILRLFGKLAKLPTDPIEDFLFLSQLHMARAISLVASATKMEARSDRSDHIRN